MKRKRPEGFTYTIYPFMQKLGLAVPELNLYAVIYCFTKGKGGGYYGAKDRLAESIGACERTVYKYLSKLKEKQLIEGYEDEYGRLSYRTVDFENEQDYIVAEPTETILEMPVVPKYRCVYLGRLKNIFMSEEQYNKLKTLAPPSVLNMYIRKFENFLDNCPDNFKEPHSHYKVIRRWIERDIGRA